MYPTPAGPGPNQQQGGPGQRQWDPSQQGPQGQAPPQQQQSYRQDQRIPPVNVPYHPGQDPHAQNQQLRPDRPEMAAVQHHQPYYPPPPQHAVPYLPSPNAIYPPPPHPDQYRPPPPQGQSNVQQSAPRQRTAIACKYCRRRKIRCSGFENSEDGRCSNCVRFSQECVFTPVSSQAQAFVPAQALYARGGRAGAPPQPRQLYGPYGNPLPNPHDQYAQHPHPYGPHSPAAPYPYPPPNMHQPYGYPPPPPNAPQGYDPNGPNGRQRGRDDSNTPTLPPPNSGPNPHLPNQRPEDGPPQGFAYPDPSTYAPNPSAHSPSSNPGYGQHPPQYYPQQPPPHPQQGPRRGSPGSTSAYSYEPGRDSNSPHSAPGYSGYPAQQPMQPLAGGPQGSRTPPSGNGDRGRNGMSIHEMVQNEGGNTNGSNGERTAADSNMVSALNRPPPRR